MIALHEYNLVKLDTITPYEKNPRTHSPAQIEQLRASIKEFGFTNPLLIDDQNRLIAGHGRLLAAQAEGMKKVPAILITGLNDAQRRAMLIADNQLALNAGWDRGLLAAELTSLKAIGYDIAVIGFSDGELKSLWGTEAEVEDPPIPELPSAPVSAPGDVWLLGSHRIMCGDSRNADHMATLLAGDRINVAFTSPPYAEQRIYDKTSGFQPIPPSEYVEWFASVAANVANHLCDDGSWFVNIKPGSEGLDTFLYVFDLVIAHVRQWGWHFATEFCWERNGMPKSVTQRFKNQFEPIYQFTRGRWKMRPDAVRHASANVPMAGGTGVGDTSWAENQGKKSSLMGGQTKKRKQSETKDRNGDQGSGNFQPGEYIGPGLAYPGNRLPTFTSSHEALGHAAAFPIGLPEFFINAYTDKNDVVLDPFLGSGSTLIAAHRTARIGRGMELSPAYVDVAVLRWQNVTGLNAVHSVTGKPF